MIPSLIAKKLFNTSCEIPWNVDIRCPLQLTNSFKNLHKTLQHLFRMIGQMGNTLKADMISRNWRLIWLMSNILDYNSCPGSYHALLHNPPPPPPPPPLYPKKYAHGFVVLCFVVVMQSFIMNTHEVFIHNHQGCFAGTGAIVRLPQCQWSKPDGYGKISQCITRTKHSKAKTVCIFLGIYCIYLTKIKLHNLMMQIIPSTSGIWGKYAFPGEWFHGHQLPILRLILCITTGLPQCNAWSLVFSV